MSNFGFVSEFFIGDYGTLVKTVNTKHLMLRIWIICELKRMRNKELLQTTDR